MVVQQSDLNDNNQALCDAIALSIAENPQQQITFAEYMDLVLYHPQQGYYATNAAHIGPQGDFFTSPHLGSDFGELLAEQFVNMWEILGKPSPFTLGEMGAGQGILAADILKYLQLQYPDFFNVLEYIIVEKSIGIKREQQQRLQGLPLKWCALEEIPNDSIIGVVFSNELVDAFPVHLFVIEQGQLREIYVSQSLIGIDPIVIPPPSYALDMVAPDRSIPLNLTQSSEKKGFVEVTGEPSTPKLAEYFQLVGIQLPSSAYPDGYRSEVNLAALDWVSMVSNKLKQGYLLTIDYGYSADRYYTPARQQGTLQCYYRHRHHDNPYVNIGRQDITAHVDFTALERWGELCGLQKVGFVKQEFFLMALGLGSRMASLSSIDATNPQAIHQVLQRREALHQLINPMGLGGFGVLVQSKGLTADQKARRLKGLSMPI
ncbi:class I SAM-dependent methyltransferase [Microseira sp. BLCC-F43]|jgi:SAM-dependent MidA family methyltransferase|uniref:class I SAM-dependent methyltransferase n=1 Tax=Microseira sp. BLCC-F43 TaxID=3153602 RepID=UPI0035B917AE